jgi:hypothetical protein
LLHGAEAIIKRWVATDVTTNPKVQQEMTSFFLHHSVKSVAMSEGNMGCPSAVRRGLSAEALYCFTICEGAGLLHREGNIW